MEFKELSDLGLISGLVALGYTPHERIKRGKKVFFVFEWSDELERIKEDYFNNRLFDVDIRTFHTTMKAIKYSIYNTEE